MALSRSLSPIEFIKKYSNARTLLHKSVELSGGATFEFWHYPLTSDQREKANKVAGDDLHSFALQVFVNGARTKEGNRMFSQGNLPELKHEVRDSDLQKMMAAILSDEEDDETIDEATLDMKSAEGSAQEG